MLLDLLIFEKSTVRIYVFLLLKKRTLIFYKHDGPTMYVVAVFLARENWMNQF